MFRRPKKKPSALRGGPSSSGGVADVADNTSGNDGASKKRRRKRQNSSSSEEDNGHINDDEEGTSDLLQQIRQERDDAKSKNTTASKKLNTSSTSALSKKKKKNGESKNDWMHQYKSDDVTMSAQEMATRTAEYHPTDNNNNKQSTSSTTTEDAVQNSQIAALQKQPRNKFLAGPLRATTFVRTTARFDYQPDICKDYKETGFCGFGDTCIYLHDRGDTKTGWQMEQEYEEKKKREEEKKGKEMEAFMNSMMCGEVKGGLDQLNDGNDDEKLLSTDDGLPYACHICRGPFNSPIVTTCGHYFCEKCMQTRVREMGTGCPICQKDTHGVLNHAQKLVAKKRRLVGRDGTWDEYLQKSKGGGKEE